MDLRRRIVTSAIVCVLAAATFLVAPARGQEGAAILVYHRFGPTSGSTTVSDVALDRQLSWLTSHARVGSLHAVVAALENGDRSAGRPCVAITADDGHRSVFTDLYPRLRRYHLPATLFIYPSAISNASYALTWPELAQMAGSGLIDVQSHTYWHPNFRQEKARRPPADYAAFVRMQLVRSREVIAARLGRPVDLLAWPFAIHDGELEAAAAAAGYTAAFVLGNRPALPGTDRFALPRIWMTDQDQGARLAAIVAAACGGQRP